MSLNGGLKIVLPILATVAIVAPLGWMWQTSRVPGTYSVMNMGYPDYGGGHVSDSSSGGEMQGHVHNHHSLPSRIQYFGASTAAVDSHSHPASDHSSRR